jgi:hypothetical protein
MSAMNGNDINTSLNRPLRGCAIRLNGLPYFLFCHGSRRCIVLIPWLSSWGLNTLAVTTEFIWDKLET